jgi:hypothetical protein
MTHKSEELRSWVALSINTFLFCAMLVFLAFIFADVAYSVKASLEAIVINTGAINSCL